MKNFDWGVFHDGTVVALQRSGEDIYLRIEIDYLTELIKPRTNSIIIKANKVQGIQFQSYEGEKETDLVKIQEQQPEILYYKQEGDMRVLECTKGILSVVYLDEQIFNDEGTPIEPDVIYQVSKKYWDDFEKGIYRDPSDE